MKDIKNLQEKKLQEILDPKTNSALLIIDMQIDFVSPEGKSARNWNQNISYMQAIIPKIEAVAQMFYKLKKPVIWTINYENVDERTTAGRDRAVFFEHVSYPDDETFGVACLRGSDGAKLAMTPRSTDIVIEKNRSSAYTPELEKFLQEKGILTLFIVGVKTQRCVEATVRDLYDKSNVHVVTVEDCVASDDMEQHESSIKELREFYPPALTSVELLAAWKGALDAATTTPKAA